MPLIEQLNETQLKGLKYSDFGSKKPLITKDHTKKPFVDKLGLQASQRIDDLARLTKLMASGPGLKFQANQALLQQGDTLKDLKKGVKSGFKNFDVKKLKDKAVDTLKNNAMATVSILAQVPVNGTGTHFINNGGSTYLKQGGNAEPGTGFGDFLRNATGAGVGQVDGATSALNGELIIPDNDGSEGFNEIEIADTTIKPSSIGKLGDKSQNTYTGEPLEVSIPSTFGGFPGGSVSTSKTYLGKSGEARDTVKSGNKVIVDKIAGKVARSATPNQVSDENQLGEREKSALAPEFDSKLSGANNPLHDDVENIPEYLHLKKQAPEDSAKNPYLPYTTSPLNIHKRYQVPDSGNTFIDLPQKVDQLNAKVSGAGYGDLIPLSFTTVTPEKTRSLQFRAFLDDLSDNYSGDWSGTRYVGRAEEFYTYQGFKREISFSFKIAALSPTEMVPMYNRLNHLVGTTAPSYNSSGKFMRGTLTTVRLGHYLYNLTGFISSVNLTWDKVYPWEVDVDQLGLQRLPHILNVGIQFTPIHDFNVKSDLDYPKEKYIGWRGEVGKTSKSRTKSSGKKSGNSRGPSSTIQNISKG